MPLENEKKERFKYLKNHLTRYKFVPVCTQAKKVINTSFGRVKLFLDNFDWITIRNDIVMWSGEVVVEGLVLNFTTWVFLGVPFTIPFILAHGIVVKELIYIWSRLKKDGQTPAIPKKQ